MTNDNGLAHYGRALARAKWIDEECDATPLNTRRTLAMLAAIMDDGRATCEHLSSIRELQSCTIRELVAISELLAKPKRKAKKTKRARGKK